MSAIDEGMERIRASFRARAAGHSAELRTALETGDREGLRTLSHKLCGTAGTLGFGGVSEGAMQVEDMLDNGADIAEVRSVTEALAALLESEAAHSGAVR